MKYISKLTKAQKKKLLDALNFVGIADYVDHFLYLGDFTVVNNKNDKEATRILRNFLYSIFGEEYKVDLYEYLQEKKEEIFDEANNKAKELDEEFNMLM